MREKIAIALKAAMKSGDELEKSTLRLVSAAIKSKDIDHRAQTGSEDGISDAEIIGVLSTMVKQRRESAESYKKGKRNDLAERELAEIKVISRFLPKPLSEEETEIAIQKAIAETDAQGPKDISRVIAALKAAYPGQLDFAKVSVQIKKELAS